LTGSGDENWPFAHAVDWTVQLMKPRIRFGTRVHRNRLHTCLDNTIWRGPQGRKGW